MQKTLDSYLMKPGWTCLPGTDLPLYVKNAGGGGDCMFHSIAAALGSGLTFAHVRRAVAEMVTEENAPDALMDMAAQCPASLDAAMHPPANNPSSSSFSPESAWNESKGHKDVMAASLRDALNTPGNYLWGDATAAALAEIAYNVNVILLAPQDTFAERDVAVARTIYGRWVENTMSARGDELRRLPAEEVVAVMASIGLTWERAMSLSRRRVSSAVCGKRQPVGTVRKLCTNPESGNLSAEGYSPGRPTIMLWNISNVHWVPVSIGPSFDTVVPPGHVLRSVVDSLLPSDK